MIGQCPFVVREHPQKLLWQILPIGEYPQKLLWQILLVGVQTEMCQSDGKQKGGGVWNSPQR